MKMCMAMADAQEGIMEIMMLWREWRNIQRNLGSDEEKDRELGWGAGNLEM